MQVLDMTFSYTWTQGRELQQIAKTGTMANDKYNNSGIFVQKRR